MKKRMMAPVALLLAACAPAGPVAAPAPAAAGATPAAEAPGALPLEIRWFRGSAEQRAAFLQTYRTAAERLREMADSLPRDRWAVILDADETVLDNSAYQVRRATQGLGFTNESWNQWVREEAAPALPGAVEFTRLVGELGGRVVIVTNRDEVVCAETRRNLERLGVAAAAVLCKPEGQSDKNPRFQAVEAGRIPGLPPLRVVMWVGDNIQDFPGLTQQAAIRDPALLERFGRTWWVLPNPMYGSWERNVVQ